MTTKRFDPHGPAKPVLIPLEDIVLHGDLRLTSNARGLVVFVHGSGSSRFSPRNRYVAEELNKQGLATLLLDLLTEAEHKIDEETMQYRFDIPMLAGPRRSPPGRSSSPSWPNCRSASLEPAPGLRRHSSQQPL